MLTGCAAGSGPIAGAIFLARKTQPSHAISDKAVESGIGPSSSSEQSGPQNVKAGETLPSQDLRTGGGQSPFAPQLSHFHRLN